jgi:RNase P subunit RPR2
MVMASIYIRDDIKINSGELFDAKQQISNINNVKHNYSQFEEKVIYLFMAEKITQEERELCEEYSNKLESITSYSNRGMDTEASRLVTDYCNSYLIERNGKYVEFKSAMKELLTTLEKIQEE